MIHDNIFMSWNSLNIQIQASFEDLFFFIRTLHHPKNQKATLHVGMDWYNTSYYVSGILFFFGGEGGGVYFSKMYSREGVLYIQQLSRNFPIVVSDLILKSIWIYK